MEPDARNRAPRQAAYERAAAAHQRAGDVEKEAAALFDRVGKAGLAARHRAASRREGELARADGERAARWS